MGKCHFMIYAPSEAKRKRLSEIAEGYERRGYEVLIFPSPSQLPEFLRPYGPDMVAEGPDESVVVEVKPAGRSVPPERWRNLAEAVQDHPGWRLELYVGHSTFGEDLEPLTRREILARLREGQELAGQGRGIAALLMTWTAAEAAVRLLFEAEDVEAPDRRPSTLITRLYSNGAIDREDYDALMRGMRLRNAIAHGFRAPESLSDVAASLYRSVRRLLGWRAQAKKAAAADPAVTKPAVSAGGR